MSDYALGTTIYLNFTTRSFSTGVPTVLAGSPVVSVLEENNATPITAGVSVEVSRASVVGLNQVTIVATSGNGYESGKEYEAYISTGTVGGVSVVGECVGHFTIEKASALRPTTTGRTLDVTAGGNAGIDWANVEAPTTTVGLSGTTVKTATDVETDTADIQARIPAALTADGNIKADTLRVGGTLQTAGDVIGDTNDIQTRLPAALTANGNMKSSLLEIIATALTEGAAGRIAAAWQGMWNVASPVATATSVNQTGDSFARIGVAGAGLTNIDLPNQTMDITGNITGNLSGSVGSVTGAVGSVTGAVGSVTGSVGSVVGLTAANLDATISSRAAASTALSTATWTAARAGYLDTLNALAVKKNTALTAFEFVMALSSDHVTGATGKTVTATRSIDGAAFGACANSVTEVANGVYKINLAAADLNGNTITFQFTAASCDTTFVEIITQP